MVGLITPLPSSSVLLTRKDMRLAIAAMKHFPMYGFDTETDGLHGPQTGFSFGAPDEGLGWYVPIRHRTLFDCDQPSLEDVKAEFTDFFMDPDKVALGHNIGYDLMTFWRDGMDIARYEDSQLLGWLTDEKKSKALKTRAKLEGLVDDTIKFGSLLGSAKSIADVPYSTVAPYAIQDIKLPFALRKFFMRELRDIDPKLIQYYYTVELPFLRLLAEMTHAGVTVDVENLRGLKSTLLEELRAVQYEIFEAAGDFFKISSPDEVARILYTKHDLPVLKLTPGGKPSTDKETLEKLAKEGHTLPKLLTKYSKMEKFITSFTDTLLEKADENDRIHTSLNQTGTETGRLSSSDPNLQNIPRDARFRRVFIVPKGLMGEMDLVLCDYSQLELRVLAHFSQDAVMLHAFNNDIDLHAVTAAKIFRVSIEEVFEEAKTAIPLKMRDKAKTINFKIVYGGGQDLEKGVTKEVLDEWGMVHIGGKSYIAAHRRMMVEVTGGRTETLFGRYRTDKRVFLPRTELDPKKKQPLCEMAQRALFSGHIQGSAADLVKGAMLDINADIRKYFPGARMLLQVHDEIMTECYSRDSKNVAKMMKYRMENVYKLNNVPLKVDPKIGKSWAAK